jgi:hypothetical protein
MPVNTSAVKIELFIFIPKNTGHNLKICRQSPLVKIPGTLIAAGFQLKVNIWN